MSIYVLRYGALVKIGFSSNLVLRVGSIISSIPGDVTFVGHMPGDRELEAHLHDVFASSRFSGEWFASTPELERVLATLLIKSLPEPPARAIPNRLDEVEAALRKASADLRAWSALEWPTGNHTSRIDLLTQLLGWKKSRVQSLYNAERKAAPKPHEVERIATLVGVRAAAPTDPQSTPRVEK